MLPAPVIIMLEKIVPLLPVHSLLKTISFYRDQLHFHTIHYGSSMVASKDNIALQFFEYTGKGPLPISECCIYVNNIEDLYARLSSLDVIRPAGQIKNPTSFPKEFSVVDNNGHTLKFRQN